jgi:ankyrin repeat protein
MSLDLNFKAVDNNGNSALHIATRNGNTKMAFKVLLKNPDFKSENKKGLSAFQMAKNYQFDNIEGLFVSPITSACLSL